MTSIVDYAGLYPPAGLDMATTVRNWAGYASGPDAWMLGRLVIPVARLDEFAREAERFGPRWMVVAGPDSAPEPWRISALVGDKLDADIDRIFEFNRQYAPEDEPPPLGDAPQPGAPADRGDRGERAEKPGAQAPTEAAAGILIDAIEVKATSAQQIDAAMHAIPEQLDPYIEVPVSGDLRGLIAAMAGTGARAKVRTGGVTPEAIPSARDVAKFIFACAAADVPFKATAGLHHPIRAEYGLTYEKGCPRAPMFGYLNVFLAAAMIKAVGPGKLPIEELTQILEEANPAAFVFDKSGVTWRDRRVDLARLARVRESFATTFGSCSFEEPVNELRALGLLKE
jgi:hypothetical protein